MRKLNKYDKELEEAWAAATAAATTRAAWTTRAARAAWAATATTRAATRPARAARAAAWAAGDDELEHQIEMTLKVLLRELYAKRMR